MVVGKEFFNVTYKERSLDAKTAQLIHFAVSVAIGYEFGAKHHLAEARECGATDDEITETIVYTMQPAAAKVRNFGNSLISK
jgi:AhpD family alkylhydroperoxidase